LHMVVMLLLLVCEGLCLLGGDTFSAVVLVRFSISSTLLVLRALLHHHSCNQRLARCVGAAVFFGMTLLMVVVLTLKPKRPADAHNPRQTWTLFGAGLFSINVLFACCMHLYGLGLRERSLLLALYLAAIACSDPYPFSDQVERLVSACCALACGLVVAHEGELAARAHYSQMLQMKAQEKQTLESVAAVMAEQQALQSWQSGWMKWLLWQLGQAQAQAELERQQAALEREQLRWAHEETLQLEKRERQNVQKQVEKQEERCSRLKGSLRESHALNDHLLGQLERTTLRLRQMRGCAAAIPEEASRLAVTRRGSW